MNKKILSVAAGLAVAIGGLAAPSLAGPFERSAVVSTTSNTRINSMMRRLDQFEQRRAIASPRLYVSRDGQRVAINQVKPQGSYRLNP